MCTLKAGLKARGSWSSKVIYTLAVMFSLCRMTQAWIHVSAAGAGADLPALLLLRDIAAKAAAAGAGLVIHLERLIPEPDLEDLHKAGAFLLFHVPPSDYRSPYRALRAKASRRVLDPRAYYLYSEFMR